MTTMSGHHGAEGRVIWTRRVTDTLGPNSSGSQAGHKLGGIEWDNAVHACTVNHCNIP